MKCPDCGAELVPEIFVSLPFRWLGEETMLECHDYKCPVCNKIIMDEAAPKMDEQMRNFQTEVRKRLMPPDKIKTIRKKLGLSQNAAADIFGVGINAFRNYEKGNSLPPLALMQLLRILDKKPELLEIITS